MAAKEAWGQLDELIAKTTERVSTLRRENSSLQGKVRELEADRERLRAELDEASGEGKRVGELEARVKKLEQEREEARKRVETAAGKLRKLLAGRDDAAETPELAEEAAEEPAPEEPVGVDAD